RPESAPELDITRRLHGQVSRLPSPDNSAGVDTSLAVRIRKVASVAHKATRDGKLTHRIDCRYRMAPRQRNDVIAALVEEWIGTDKERAAALSRHGRECCVDLPVGTGTQDNQLQSKHTRRRLHISQLCLGTWKIRIHERRDCGGAGNEFAQQS